MQRLADTYWKTYTADKVINKKLNKTEMVLIEKWI